MTTFMKKKYHFFFKYQIKNGQHKMLFLQIFLIIIFLINHHIKK